MRNGHVGRGRGNGREGNWEAMGPRDTAGHDVLAGKRARIVSVYPAGEGEEKKVDLPVCEICPYVTKRKKWNMNKATYNKLIILFSGRN